MWTASSSSEKNQTIPMISSFIYLILAFDVYVYIYIYLLSI